MTSARSPRRPGRRPVRRRAVAALLATAAVGGLGVVLAAPASAYGGYANWGKAWVDHYASPDYARNWTDPYNGGYADRWVPAKPLADVKVTAEGPAHLDHNEEQRWVVEITNSGTAPAQSVRSSTTMPNGITYLAHRISQGSASQELTGDGRIVLTIGTLKPGETVRLEIAGRAPSYGGGTVELANTVSTSSPESNTSNNSAAVRTRIA